MRFELGHFKLSTLFPGSPDKAVMRFQFERWIELPESIPIYEESVIRALSVKDVTDTPQIAPPLETIKYGRCKVEPWPWADEPRYVYVTIDNLKEVVEWMSINEVSA